MTTTTFTDGSTSANLLFQQGTPELVGPSVRVFANSTVTGGSVVVSGAPGYLNATTVETSSADFSSYSRADNISFPLGAITAGNDSRLLRFEPNNSFGNATLTTVAINSEGAAVSSGTSGTLVTENQTAPPAGWGNLLASVGGLRNSTITFSLLDGNGSVVAASVPAGSTISVDPALYPTLRVRAAFALLSGEAPILRWFQLGQAAGDTLFGTALNRTANGVQLNSTTAQLSYNFSSITKYASNPIIPRVLSTYYSVVLATPNVIKVGSEWWLYFGASTAPATTQSIARAVSTDLNTWTVGSTPVLNRSASGWDQSWIGCPYVMENPSGSGFLMYYVAGTTGSGQAIGLATSPDGVTWTKVGTGPVLAPSSSGWDSTELYGAQRVVYTNGTWTMWYLGNDKVGSASAQSDLGIATSNDGINWTRYGSNPVMSHGGSPNVDTNDIAWGHMMDFVGLTVFYYSCTTTTQFDLCLATSSDGGYTWTKLGRVLLRGSGFDSYDLYQPYMVINNGTLYIFYSGSDGSKAQIGRATVNIDRGFVRGTTDFGIRIPSRFTSLALNATAPNGSTVEFAIRTSSNGATFSAWENLTGVAVPTSVPARYVEYIVYLNWTSGAFPSYSGFQMGYTGFVNLSRYESSAFAAADPITGASLTVAAAGTTGAYSLDLSVDNRSTWTRVLSGQYVALNGSAFVIYYGITIEAATNGAPLIDSVSIAVERRAYPENVTVRMGQSGSRFLNVSGTMAASYNLSLPVNELNAAVAAAVAVNPAITSIDFPIIVTSSHFGLVVVSAPVLSLQLKNPLFASFLPAASSLNVDENSTTAFSASAYSFPPTVPANVTWYLDGVLQSVAGNASLFNYTADFFSAGNHTVRCQVENGDFTANRTWPIAVRNVNRPPSFATLTPASPLSASHTATVQLTASATDLDLENISYSWTLDGAPVASNVTSLDVSGLLVGLHRINVTASDGLSNVTYSWALTITNALPVLVSADPPGAFSLSHTASKTVSAVFVDPDSEAGGYLWFLDGNAVVNGLPSLEIGNLSIGGHSLRLTVSDAYGSSWFQWNITSTNDAPVLLAFDPGNDFSMSHAATQTLSISVSDSDGDLLAFTWTLDGAPSGSTGPVTTISGLAVGPHSVVARAFDGYTAVTRRWNVTSTNLAPIITMAGGPAAGQSLSHSSTVDLSIDVNDIDGDAMTIFWYHDGVLVASNVTAYSLDPLGLGFTTIRVVAYDPYASTQWDWNANGNNTAPVILGFSPTARTSLSMVDVIALSVDALDADGDTLTYQWSIDLASIPSAGPTLLVGPLRLGYHVVLVLVSDGLVDVTHEFEVESENLGPEITVAIPEGPQTFFHFETRIFTVDAFDHEGDSLTYEWNIDNTSLLSHTNASTVGPLSDGVHLLEVAVSDGLSRVSFTWLIRVSDRAPFIDGVAPAPGAFTVGTREAVNFSARLVDPDGDPSFVRWLEDNRVINGSAGIMRSWDSAGTHSIVFEGTAGGLTKTVAWNVTVVALNQPPTLSSPVPSSHNVTVTIGQGAGFVVDVNDDEVLPLDVTWYLDGVVVAHGTGFVYEPKTADVGTHLIRVEAADSEFSASNEWTVTVQGAAPIQTGTGFDLTALIVGLAAGVGVAMVFFMTRLRKGGQAPPPPTGQ